MYTSINTTKSSKYLNEIVFSLNSDDFKSEHIRKITKYVKSLGYEIRKTRTYSQTKLMSWCNVTVTTNRNVTWDINNQLALEIINNALK